MISAASAGGWIDAILYSALTIIGTETQNLAQSFQ
jgi:hypothetical protein